MQFIDPGGFRNEMSLQQAVTTPDGTGGHDESWNEIATLFAAVEPLAATARFGAAQEHETVTHRITLRFRDDLQSGMRLVKQGRVFAVVNVHDPDETGRYLVCRAREEGR
ncbi:phage head closure protein [Nitratireductor soli]|uniref:phage head closure protein n=1 Tax=Nitratireductor soli TaxID=1670619 RepID=UPI003CC7A32E